VFADYLVMVGDSWDSNITPGLTSAYRPYILLASVTVPDSYYWAKVLSLRPWSSFVGVKFSNDGTLLIANCNANPNYIVVFDVMTGTVLTARYYSSSGYYNYNSRVKSMEISSGPSPMAYILSNIRSTSAPNLCTGQYLFKIDPIAIASAWIKMTSASKGNDCGHLGLTFGRAESVVYAFSMYNSLPTITLIDTAGNSIW
jgi:hypothetical protein